MMELLRPGWVSMGCCVIAAVAVEVERADRMEPVSEVVLSASVIEGRGAGLEEDVEDRTPCCDWLGAVGGVCGVPCCRPAMKGVLKKDGLVDDCAGGEAAGGDARGEEVIGFETIRDCSA